MLIKNTSGKWISQGRVFIKRIYDDFTNELPNWLNIDGTKSVNNNDSLVITKGALPASVITSKLYLFSAYDAIQLELGNYIKNTLSSNDGFFIESEDSTIKLEIKNISTATNSDIGIYYNSELLETIGFKDLVWNNSLVVNKPCTYTFNYNIQHGSITLLSNNCIMREIFLPTKLVTNKKYKFGFSSTSSTITMSQVILRLWKSI